MHNQNSSRFDTKPVNKIILISLVGLSVYALYTIFNTNNDIAFENNLKCSKFIEQEKLRVESISYSSSPTVFYSSKLKTCVSAYSIHNLEIGYDGYFIEDILTNNTIFTGGGKSNEKETMEASQRYILKQSEIK